MAATNIDDLEADIDEAVYYPRGLPGLDDAETVELDNRSEAEKADSKGDTTKSPWD